jgi:hypothetical protein
VLQVIHECNKKYKKSFKKVKDRILSLIFKETTSVGSKIKKRKYALFSNIEEFRTVQ